MPARFRLSLLLTLVALASPHALAAEPEGPRFATGLEFAADDAYRSIPLAAPPLMGSLPSRIDMSAEFPTPGQQGEQGSCVGWAVSYVRSRDAARRQGWRPEGAERVFSPAFIFNQINRSPACQGSLYVDALDLLTRGGVAPLASFPYDPNDCRRQPDATAQAAAQPWRVQTWRRVNVQDTTEVKSHLAAGYPVLIGMIVDQAFAAQRAGAVYDAPGGVSLGGHAMALVGYDDARQAFKVINSWGTAWGEGGFGWIGYGVFRGVVREGYVVQDFKEQVTPGPTPGPGPTPTPGPTPPAPTVPVVSPSPLAPPAVTPVQTPYGPGGAFQVAGQLRGVRGRQVQIVIRFGVQLPGGAVQQIPASPQSPFRDFNGGVATGCQPFTAPDDVLDLSRIRLDPIPAMALNATGTVLVQADLYVDGFNLARSTLGTVTVPSGPPLGRQCCDGFGRPWCALQAPLPLGSGCFCYGVSGSGAVCP